MLGACNGDGVVFVEIWLFMILFLLSFRCSAYTFITLDLRLIHSVGDNHFRRILEYNECLLYFSDDLQMRSFSFDWVLWTLKIIARLFINWTIRSIYFIFSNINQSTSCLYINGFYWRLSFVKKMDSLRTAGCILTTGARRPWSIKTVAGSRIAAASVGKAARVHVFSNIFGEIIHVLKFNYCEVYVCVF